MYQNKPRLSYGVQLAIFVGLFFGAIIITSIIQLGFMMSVMSFKDLLSGASDSQIMQKELFKPSNRITLVLMQVFAMFSLFCLPAFLFAKIVHGKSLIYLGLKVRSNKIQIGLVVLLAFIGLGLSGALGELNELIPLSASLEKKFRAMEAEYQAQVLAIASMKNFGEYIVALLVIAILPAFFEEVFFRGVVQQFLERWTSNGWFAVIFTSILFSAFHMSYFGFLPRLGLGIVLGLIFYFSRNLWLSILLHFLNNAVAVTALYYSSIKGLPLEKVLDEKFPLWLGAIALVIVFYLLRMLYNISVANGSHNLNNTIPPSDNPFDNQSIFNTTS